MDDLDGMEDYNRNLFVKYEECFALNDKTG